MRSSIVVFGKQSNRTGEDSENNSWNKYAKNVCAIAAYITRFDSEEDMIKYFNRAKNVDERIALADELPQRYRIGALKWLVTG